MWRATLALVLLPLLAAGAEAQCLAAPAPSGCPGFPELKSCTTNPSIGSLWCVASAPCPPPPCGSLQINLFFLGSPLPFPSPFPSCCTPGPCFLYSAPTFLWFTEVRLPGTTCYPIPPNPALVGASIGLQAGCLPTAPPLCLDLSPGLAVMFRP